MKNKYFNLEWFEIYDLVEYLPELFTEKDLTFYGELNKVLEEESAGYRFVNNLIVQIIDEVEIKERIVTELKDKLDATQIEEFTKQVLEIKQSIKDGDIPNLQQ